ncbi:unnamed protein product, partial [Musa banksii]
MGLQRTRLLFPVDKRMESYVKNLKGELSCSTRTRRTVPPTPPPLPLPLSVHKVFFHPTLCPLDQLYCALKESGMKRRRMWRSCSTHGMGAGYLLASATPPSSSPSPCVLLRRRQVLVSLCGCSGLE